MNTSNLSSLIPKAALGNCVMNSLTNFHIGYLQGYSEEMLRELQMTSQWTGDKQLHFVLSKALERKDITRSDIMARLKSMIKGMHSPAIVFSS